MKFTIYLHNPTKKEPEALKTLKENDKIEQIISSNEQSFSFEEALSASASDYILLLHEDQIFDPELLEEYEEILEEKSYDIVYPNYVIEGKIRNFSEWEERNYQLLQTFDIENEVPQWGSCIKKNRFKDIKDSGCFSFYDFLYRNMDDLSLKLSEFSFVEWEKILPQCYQTFYHSKTLREILNQYDLKNVLFPYLNWDKENIAYATAYTLIGDKLNAYDDHFNASKFYREALMFFHNQETVLRLVDTYYQMGLFDEAMQLVESQLSDENHMKSWESKIESTKKLINNLEHQIQLGNIKEIMELENEILNSYHGALVYNIFGIGHFQMGNFEKAYDHLMKAAIKNPIDSDILYNIVEIGKKLDKTSEIKQLYAWVLET